MPPLPSPLRRPAAALAAVLAALAAGCGGAEAPAARRPDVVLVVIDTLRADRLGCYGHPRPTSPRLDRLAAEGALFEDVTAQSSWTLPSMVSLLSGRYVTRYRDVPDPAHPLLAEAFRAAGYRTVGVVGNVLLAPERGWDRGFDAYDARPRTTEPEVRSRSIDELAAALEAPLADALAPGPGGARPPVFVYLHPFDPHAPYEGDPALDAELPPDAASRARPEGWWRETYLAHASPSDAPGRLDRELAALVRERGRYEQDVRRTDDGLARLLDRLEELGVLDHAVVAVASDHGECLWERVAPMPPAELASLPPADLFYQEHGAYLTQEAIRTPLLLWGAGVPAGVRVAAPVENVDLLPTLLELCDVPARGELHGRSLVPLLRDGEPAPEAWRDATFSAVLHGSAVRDLATGEVLHLPSEVGREVGARPSLFDLDEDPLERRDLYRPDAPAAARLEARLEAWVERHPTETTFGRRRDAAEEAALEALGYTDAHTGG